MNKVSTSQHVPVLDGIRGMAILMVMVCHTLSMFKALGGAYVSGFQNFLFFVFGSGWLGVDLFFVLSGYLITRILINSRGEQNYFVNFYARRTLRIFPIYYLYITVVIFILPLFIPYMRVQIQSNLALNYLYLQNTFVFLSGSLPEYLMGHLWSLAVEEHFYLIWPLVVYKVKDKRIFHVGVAVIIGALLLRNIIIFGSGFRTGAVDYYTYRFTFCRADALMLGAMLAYAVRNIHLSQLLQRYGKACLYGSGLLSVMLLIYAYFQDPSAGITNSNKVISSIGYTIFPLFFTFIIYNLLNSTSESLSNRFFDNTMMRFFGKYSYAIYIVHYPVIAFIYANFLEDFNYDPLTKVLILFVVTITSSSIIAWLSYHLFEKHFLSLKRYFVSGRYEPNLEKIALEST